MIQVLHYRLETDLVRDVVDELGIILLALRNRHGEPFRRLEREILDLEGELECPDLHFLGIR